MRINNIEIEHAKKIMLEVKGTDEKTKSVMLSSVNLVYAASGPVAENLFYSCLNNAKYYNL